MSKVYTVYVSAVSGSVFVVKNTTRVKDLLDGLKVQYKEIDISLDENAEHKQIMRSKSKSEKPFVTPQVFLNGEYIADCDTLNEWVEYEELKDHFQ